MNELYKKTKTGKVQSWHVEAVGEKIITTHGLLNGKQQATSKRATAKNVGRSNEISAVDQAALQAASMWRKKRNKGYFETVEEALNKLVLLPMLAHDFHLQVKELVYPVSVQVKLNGVRCLAYWKDGVVVLMSRGGMFYNIPHIAEAVSKFLPKDMVLDGEIYIHGMVFQDIVRRVKKLRDMTAELEYWVYDCFSLDNLSAQWVQRERVMNTVLMNSRYPVVEVVSTRVRRREHLEAKHNDSVRSGYEGIIIRTLNGPYEIGHRSRELLKYKTFKDAEYEIIGVEDGVGKFVGCAIWICVTPEGKEFRVTPKGTLAEKKKLFASGGDCIGRLLTVKYQDLTKDGIPQFPVGLGIRLEEDR